MAMKFVPLDAVLISDRGGLYHNPTTVRPRGTRPRGTRTSLGHDFKKGSQIFKISDFETQPSLGHDFRNLYIILIMN